MINLVPKVVLVHGVVHDTIDFARSVLAVELNSATDNPMILANRDMTISCGNFHGEYPAKTLDILAIGVHELASISERRIERHCNPNSSGLPAFLAPIGGLHSGFMMAHVTASALVSENKVKHQYDYITILFGRLKPILLALIVT